MVCNVILWIVYDMASYFFYKPWRCMSLTNSPNCWSGFGLGPSRAYSSALDQSLDVPEDQDQSEQ